MRRRSKLLVRPVHAALLFAFAACAAPKPPPSHSQPDLDAEVLTPTDLLARPPFVVLQRVRGKYGSQNVAFECEVRLSQGKLTILGMTPYSQRAFLIEQEGAAVQAQAFMMRDVWLEPLQVLYDVHRALFRGSPVWQSDGTHDLVDRGEVVRELWWGGHVVQRSFHALDTFSSLFVITFEGAPAPLIAPRMRVTNLHHSYSLVIETVEQKRLDEGFSLGIEKKSGR